MVPVAYLALLLCISSTRVALAVRASEDRLLKVQRFGKCWSAISRLDHPIVKEYSELPWTEFVFKSSLIHG